MKTKRFLFLIMMIFANSFMFAQTGIIRGVVMDDITGELLPGVTVAVDSTSKGAITDLDGNFNIKIEPGIYKVRISYVSYSTLIIDSVVVKTDEVNLIGNIRLKEAVNELGPVTVSAGVILNNDEAMSTVKKKSPNLIDGFSAEGIKKTGDGDGASAAKRIPGVSVTGGKYVFIRGLGDRYTKTTLNSMDVPGLDPDRNTIQMDIFPSNVIDNIIIHKSFVAELPADFTGGIVDISLKDFPSQKKSAISIGTSYNPYFHLQNEYLDYEGSKTDFLGFDDGTRNIPAEKYIPFYTDALSDPNGVDGQRYKEILGKFNPTMAAMQRTSGLDLSMSADFGNQIVKEKATIGFNLMFSYRNETEFYKDAIFSRYGTHSETNINELRVFEYQKGNYGVNNVLLTGMAGFAIKTANSKFRINLIRIQNGESKAGIFDYEKSDQGSDYNGFQHNLEYSQRSLSNVLIAGKHSLADNKWEIDWKISPTYSTLADPDIRFTRYEVRNDEYYIGTEAGFPQRIWRELNEINNSSALHLKKEFKFKDKAAYFRFGGAHTIKYRNFNLRSFNLNIRNVDLTGDPNELFLAENLWPLNGNLGEGTTYEATFMPTNPNEFTANVNSMAGYASAEISPSKLIKTIIGLRVENYVQRYTGQDQLGYNVLDNEKVLSDLDFFPTLNFVYSANEKNNLRLSVTKTIARPSFKELSYAEIFDPLTGRTFIGGLFSDIDEQTGVVYWDGKLKSSDIINADVRWETFPEPGTTFSIGGFYKNFKNPIEMVQFATQAGSFQARNVGDGFVAGGELEWKKSLKFISEKLSDWSVSGNITYTISQIELSATELESRIFNARDGQTIKPYRDMAGQAPYLVNAGINYKSNKDTKGFAKGWEAGIYYNVQGPTLLFVGIVNRPDIYTVPFHGLNFNANKTFGKEDRMQFGIKVENILNDKTEAVYKSYGISDDYYFSQLSNGVRFQVRFSYNIF